MNRIKHPLSPTYWPTKAEARESLLFSPGRLGKTVHTRTRTWIPAMVPWRATDEGFVTDAVLDWYGRFAEGRPGVIVVEATGIRDVPSGPLLRIGHERFLPGLRSLVDRVAERSEGETRLLIQVIDFLRINRRPAPETFFSRYLTVEARHRAALSSVADEDLTHLDEGEFRERLLAAGPAAWRSVLDDREWESLEFGYRERVTDTEKEHIRRLPEVLPDLFAAAVERAEAAGFDGAELHFAHAYTMASFLSRRNTRADGYGGSLDGRARLPLEVIAAVRARVGDYCVGCRFLGDEAIEGGTDVSEAAFFGVAFARAGLDFLSLSKGGKFEDCKRPRMGEAAYPYTGPSGHECMPTVLSDARGPFGRNLDLAATIRAAVRSAGFETPVVTAGGIGTFELAEGALKRGDADFIGAARQSLADPDWWLKVERGKGHAVRRCEYTNYCEGLDQRHKQVTCRLWDKDHAPGDGVRTSPDGRRRLVAPRWMDS